MESEKDSNVRLGQIDQKFGKTEQAEVAY